MSESDMRGLVGYERVSGCIEIVGDDRFNGSADS